jgi:threonylcarbamoyladenosine tRNA methylthiotransferase MtaB
MPKVALHTLGCKLNFAESATIARQFEREGFDVVGGDGPADVCVINTCSVTERADRECRQIVRRALRHSPDAYVIVVGCYAQLQPTEIAGIPGVDLVLGTREKFEIFRHAGGFQKHSCAQTFVSSVEEIDTFSGASSAGSHERTRAFIKVQDGCDYSCSFCTIPMARGTSRSTGIEAIVAQTEIAVANGYQEVVLTGVNVGDYGRKFGSSLLELLKELTRVSDLRRIRISSVEPNLLSDELLAFWAANPILCKHFHLPLQAGNDAILQSMRRRYLTGLYADRVARIRSLLPDAGIGADLITGFPGETDELFDATYRFLVDLPISYLHVFTYSPRPNTPAAGLAGQVEPRIRFERSERLRLLSSRKRHAFQQRFVGSVCEVLVEDRTDDGFWTGLTSQYIRVNFPSAEDLSNRIAILKISGLEGEHCGGEVLDTSSSPIHILSTTSGEVPLCA